LPGILTCRTSREGGRWDGTDVDRVSLIEALGVSEHPPRYIDFELADYLRSANLRQKLMLVVDHDQQARNLETGLILSSHDFEGRPNDLTQRVAAMAEQPPAAVSKIVWQARSLRDNLEAFELLHHRSKPTIALCMGPFGEMSRILAPKFGGFLSFASPEDAEPTAPGQLGVQELRSVFRFDSIGPATRTYGIVGWPVAGSWSPVVHNAGFDAIEHDGVFLRLPVAPGWEPFKATVGALIDHRGLDFSGASVTMPHKEHLVRFIREWGGTLDPLSDWCGAANTLVVEPSGALRGCNTDAPAAVDCLLEAMACERDELSGTRIAVLGAGGVARAITAGLLDAGADVVVANRTRARAEAMVEELSSRAPDHAGMLRVGDRNGLVGEKFDAFVNATSLGSPAGEHPEDSPLPDDVVLDDATTVLDSVYAPTPTPLLLQALQGGARVASGGSMFLRQAERQFTLWTGREVPAGVMTAALASRR
ncbi:MAG: type I 3-dehydroquinate dehydratase, partial [Planctomycetota bacterium]|nr:type I 3-dehydroquinate dehydratase [Planctomycetota bacterium]